jgi:tetratricopeptide (TPR) repeat protein
VGLFDRAETESHRALETDPENVRSLAEVAENYIMQWQARRGEEAARVALRVDPDYALSKMALLEALIAQDKLDEAQALLDQNYFGTGRHFALWFAGLIAARRGRYGEAESFGLQAVQAGEGLGPYHHMTFGLAQVFALSGKKAEAVRWLRRTAEEGMPSYPMFRDNPLLKNLRGDPEYDKLLEELRREWERRQREL